MSGVISRLVGWFQPHPPISTSSRVEIDQWLLEIRRVIGAPSQGLPSMSLASFGNDTESIGQELCRAANIESSLVAASLVDANDSQSPIDYHKLDDGVVAISMDRRLQNDRLRQVVGIAQGVAMAHWFTATGDWPVEPIRDLRVVTMGLGSLAADAFLYDETWSALGMQGWEMSRMGTLNSLEIGYAMATWQRMTGHSDSAIESATGKVLRPDARIAYQRTIAYYRSLGQKPTLVDQPDLPTLGSESADLIRLWSDGEATRIYASALAVKSRLDGQGEKLPESFADVIRGLMTSVDGDLLTVATRLWGYLKIDATVAGKPIEPMLKSRYDAVFLAAVASAIDHGVPITRFADRLAHLSNVQSGEDFIALDLMDRSGSKSDRTIETLQRELKQAERFEDADYADRLRRSIGP